MVKRFIDLLNKEFGGLHQAAFLLALSSLSSQLLGLLRDRLLAGTFGASVSLDIYYAAFRLPDLIFVSVGSFLAVTVLIPILTDKLEHDSRDEVRIFLSSLLTFFLMIIILASFLVFIFAPGLLKFVAPGFDEMSLNQLILLTRILLLSPFFLGLSNLFGAVTQSYRRFFIYAISPLLYNIGIIVGVLFFYPLFGLPGLVYGVVLGAVFHFLAQVPVLVSTGLLPTIRFSFIKKDLIQVTKMSLPRTLALGTNQLAIMALVAIASFMTAGSISIFNFAYNLQSVPMALIGISYSVAAFPTMSKFFSSGKREEFVSYMTEAMRHIIFWSLPIATLFIVLRAQIVRVILGSGNFNWDHTRLTAAALAIFSISVVCQGLILLFDRAYYAMGKTKIPVVIKIISSFSVVIFTLVFYKISVIYPNIVEAFEVIFRVVSVPGAEVLVLPLAFSLGTLLNTVWIWVSFAKEINMDFTYRMTRVVRESLFGSLVIGVTAEIGLHFFDNFLNLKTFFGIFLQGFLSGLSAIAVGFVVFTAIGNEEIKELYNSIKTKLINKKPIIPDQERL